MGSATGFFQVRPGVALNRLTHRAIPDGSLLKPRLKLNFSVEYQIAERLGQHLRIVKSVHEAVMEDPTSYTFRIWILKTRTPCFKDFFSLRRAMDICGRSSTKRYNVMSYFLRKSSAPKLQKPLLPL
jgi:hypothetical protein